MSILLPLLKYSSGYNNEYSTIYQWLSEGGRRGWPPHTPVRREWQNGGDNSKNWRYNGKNEDNKGASGISRLSGVSKLQSASGTDNPSYATIYSRKKQKRRACCHPTGLPPRL